MAAINRPTTASYEVHETVKVDTEDYEDHTFCGMMFPIKAKEILPVNKIVVRSISVRGGMGPMTVWVSNQDEIPDTNRQYNFPLNSDSWTEVYRKFHPPSYQKYVKLDLMENPICLRPGQIRAIYVHSSLSGDEAIVYDNSNGASRTRYQDSFIHISKGKAHLSPKPFGQSPIWGWGNAWRDNREFVGQIEYGCIYKLWNTHIHNDFGNNHHEATMSLLSCQRRLESPISWLSDDCIFYILNMCRWDWFQDSTTNMKEKRKRRALENLQDSDRRQRLECIEPIKDGKGTEIKKREEASGQSQNNHDGEDEQDTEYEEESGESEEEQEGRQWTSQNVTLFTHQDFSSDDEENDAEESDESAVSRSTNFNSFRRILGRLRPTNRLTHIAPVESED